jgi:hypothetical protein
MKQEEARKLTADLLVLSIGFWDSLSDDGGGGGHRNFAISLHI